MKDALETELSRTLAFLEDTEAANTKYAVRIAALEAQLEAADRLEEMMSLALDGFPTDEWTLEEGKQAVAAYRALRGTKP